MMVILRTLTGFSCGLVAGAIAFSIGWGGPRGLLLFPFVVLVMILAAGPGALVLSTLLAIATQALRRQGFRRSHLVLGAMAVGIPLGLVNTLFSEQLLHSVTGDSSVVKLADIPYAYVVGGCYGGAACGFGAAILDAGGKP